MAISSLSTKNWEAQLEKRGARGKAQEKERTIQCEKVILKKNLNSIESNFDIENLK